MDPAAPKMSAFAILERYMPMRYLPTKKRIEVNIAPIKASFNLIFASGKNLKISVKSKETMNKLTALLMMLMKNTEKISGKK